jgi:hypothetical protein
VIKRGDGLLPGQPFTLPATTASGQAITWVLVSGNATLKGNVLTPKNKGAVVVRAMVAGSSPSSSAVVEYEIESDDEDDDKKPKSRGKSAHLVDSGDGRLIAGFVVSGDAPKRVLVRGIGAALAGFGVAGALADPVLELYTAGGAMIVARNDNWETPQQASAAVAATPADILAATKVTGAFPLASGSKDAAILITLMPGSYSAVVSGANQSTGAGLVEVYEVPHP